MSALEYLRQFPPSWGAFVPGAPALPPQVEAVAAPKRKPASWSQVFERSKEWAEARAAVFARDGAVCVRCGSVERLQVDHIKPKAKYRELALDLGNLQVLCWPCNRTKGLS